MDPLTTLSLASAIVQFIEVGARVLSKGYDIYQSANGASPYNQKLQDSIDRVDRLCVDLSNHSLSGVSTAQPSANEKAVQDIANQCNDVAGTLRAALLKLQANPKSASSSLRKAFKSVWSEKQIRDMERRLANMVSELHLYLTATLRDNQSDVMKTLTAISDYQVELNTRTNADLMVLKRDLLAAISASPAAQNKSKAVKIPNNLNALALKLSNLSMESETALQKHQILKSLAFDTMRHREHSISQNYDDTFEWIFDANHASQPLHLGTWLQNEKGIFWVHGKAGCGKSTFMKAVNHDDRCETLLQTWAGSDKLVISSHFFWNAGNSLCRSQEGLLRTIVFDIVFQNPNMVLGLFRSLPRSLVQALEVDPTKCQWSLQQLLSAFLYLVSSTPEPTRFCLFIDGLDEYDGESRELAKVLKRISNLENVKLCLSSRDWPAFEDEFGKDTGTLSLVLHDHTKDDIRLYIHEVLEKDSIFAQLSRDDERYEQIIASLVAKAQGVFLWIFLVVRDISNSLPNKDSFEDVQRRIDDFPDDLDRYFTRMLDSIKPFYWKSSAEILLACLFASLPPFPLALRYFTEDQTKADVANAQIVSEQEMQRMQKTMVTRVKAQCLDLLQIYENEGGGYSWGTVSFLHRTVYDFLRQDHIYEKLRGRVAPDFHPVVAICKGYLFQLKSLSAMVYETRPGIKALKELYNIVSHIMLNGLMIRYSGLTGKENSELFVVFDNIEQALLDLSKLPQGRVYSVLNGLAASDYKWQPVPGAFLLYEAITYGQFEYAKIRFERDPSLAAYLCVGIPTLLCVLLWGSNVEIVQYILSKHPDALDWAIKDRNDTVWSTFISDHLTRRHNWDINDRRKKRIGTVVIHLVRAGADLDCASNNGYRDNQAATALEIIRDVLHPEDMQVIDELYAEKCRLKKAQASMSEPGIISRLWRWLT